MSTGEPYQFCPICQGFFMMPHSHTGLQRPTFAPYEPGDRPGAQVVPLLTEKRVREIVREELARATSPTQSAPEAKP